MITYPNFGGPHNGRLGNQVMQLMSMIGLAKNHDQELRMPKWKYSKYFNEEVLLYEPHTDNPLQYYFWFKEQFFNYNVFDIKNSDTSIYKIDGWLQSKKYWEDAQEEVKKYLTFKDEFINDTWFKLPNYHKISQKQIIGISIRRGDYIGNKNYELLPIKYYIGALIEHFPDFREKYNIMLFSDEIDYCKVHFSCLPNAYFAEGLNDIEQLCMLSQMNHHIIANSTFSMSGAYLAELRGCQGKIIRPNYNFAGDLLAKNDEKDFWPSNWTVFDHKPYKISLLDTTFTIPVKYDSMHRKENLDLNLSLLKEDFDTNIIVGEQGDPNFEYVEPKVNKFMYFKDMVYFHRTKMLNQMAYAATTPYVVNWDADVIIPPMQIIEAVNKLRTNRYDFVYPYDGRFARVPRKGWYHTIRQYNDAGMFGANVFGGMNVEDTLSLGGALFVNKTKFIEAGLENEKMISHGPEDLERYHRFITLGYKVTRINGPLYHMDHLVTMNSSARHPHAHTNKAEYDRIAAMTPDELRSEVNDWPWRNEYTEDYHESIHLAAVKSRDVIFGLLKSIDVLFKGASIIDCGCGIGSWGFECEYDYDGIDCNVPEDKLVIEKYRFKNHDLRFPIKWGQTDVEYEYSLVLCLEVAEHLEEKYADQLIDTLCSLGNKVLFGAAIPGQGGDNHYNEQWQMYWAEKFIARGFVPKSVDWFRSAVFNNKDVSVWYKQNTILYVKESGLYHNWYGEPNFVHPDMYMNLMKHYGILR